MKLIQEYLIKICITIFLLALLMELYILYLLKNKPPKIWEKIYDENIAKSENRTIKITKQIKYYLENLMFQYYVDLKLIGKHMLLLNGKQNVEYESSINKNSNILTKNKQNKKILMANINELNKEEYMRKFFDRNASNYNYINFYEKKFKNYDNNEILRDLLSDSHKELNAISYFSSVNKMTFNNEEEMNIKHIISILKTVYINRYLRKRNRLDVTRFYILNKQEIYIYPPEAFHNTYIFQYEKTPYVTCNNLPFPLCAYTYIENNLVDKESNHLFFFHEIISNVRMISSRCIKISFIKDNPNQVFLCLESDYFKIFNNEFIYPKKFEFGLFALASNRILPFLYNKDNYKNITTLFSDFEIDEFILDEKFYARNISLFHLLYYNLLEMTKEHPEIKLNFSEIIDEYYNLSNKILAEMNKFNGNLKENYIFLPFNKTICQKGFVNNSYICSKDDYKIIITPLQFEVYILDENLIEKNIKYDNKFGGYIFSIFSTNNITNKEKINTLLNIKIQRTIVLFFSLTIILFFFFLIIINFISEYSLNKIINIAQELNSAEFNSNFRDCFSLPENKISTPNKEMSLLKKIYEIMRKSIIIRQVFEDETFLDKHSTEFFNLVQNINKKDIKEICNSYIGFYHFKNEAYSIAENEFRSTILFIKEKENRITNSKDKEYDEKIKDAIKRSSTVSYINEYSFFEKIDENILQIIKIKINKQRFTYLYAMTKFKLGSELINNENLNTGSNNITATVVNKTKIKKEKEKKKKYFKDAIKYFTECKNINTLLGINQIKIIYSLIMISKSYIQLNDYRNSIININEALNLFFEFSKSFKESHSKNYNPKIMIFVESNIFQYILFTIESICNAFNKPHASNWINLKIFETSPFLFNNIHALSGLSIQNNIDRNKIKINRSDKFINNNLLPKEYEKIKKYYAKIIARMNIKMSNGKTKLLNIDNKKADDSIYSASNYNKNDTFKKDLNTGRTRSSLHNRNKNVNKVITLCLSEKILRKINGFELKDVIIKFYQKYFSMNENDKFSFIQFACNGKKTVYIKMEKLNYFLQKIQKINNTFELTESYSRYTNMPFTELFNILESIFKNNNVTQGEDSITDATDNIIIMFINSEDIRFTSMEECLKTVKELNKKNVSLFLLSYDTEISMDKINNIQSLLSGLIEGHFYQIKNYQQIKQIFINISTIQYQSNFFGYDFHTIDQEL